MLTESKKVFFTEINQFGEKMQAKNEEN